MKSKRNTRNEEDLEFINIAWLIDHHITKENERRQMVADFDLKPGSFVLDLGCGPGLWSPMLADEVKPNGKVIGIDFSPDLIDYANNNLENEPLKDMIEFKVGDFYDIPFEDNTFDTVFFGNCFAYVNDSSKTLNEQKRVTKNGGKVIAKDFDGAVIIFNPIEPDLSGRILAATAKGLKENQSNPPFNNYAGRKMHGLLIEAGLGNVSTKSYAIQKLAPLSPEAKRYITGNADWYLKTGKKYLSNGDIQKWRAYFDPTSDKYILDRKDFYFCMLEVVTKGVVP
jgi:SAM-dependent methyltransferase